MLNFYFISMATMLLSKIGITHRWVQVEANTLLTGRASVIIRPKFLDLASIR